MLRWGNIKYEWQGVGEKKQQKLYKVLVNSMGEGGRMKQNKAQMCGGWQNIAK